MNRACVQDCEGEIRSNVVRGNRRGSVAVSDLAQLGSVELAAQNDLDRPPSALSNR